MPNKATNIEGKEIFFSASSADNFQSCPRRWWFAKVMGQPEPSDPSLSFGTAVHLVLENYLRDGTLVAPGSYNEGREVVEVTQEHIDRAKAGLDLLPAPRAYNVENWLPRVKIVNDDDAVMSVVGKIDMYLPANGGTTPYHHAAWPDDVTGHVLDHKTSSDPKKWMPTSEKLATNAQGLLYAGALQKGGLIAPGDVLFTHHYVAKKGLPKSYIVHTRMHYDNIMEHWERQKDVAREMVNLSSSVRNISQQSEVRANLSACRSYGRLCPFAATCEAHKPKGVFAAIDSFDAARNGQTTQEEPPMSGGLFSKLKGREIAKAATPPVAEFVAVTPSTKPAKVKTEAPVIPPDAAPMDHDTITSAMLREAADVLRTCNQPHDPLTLSECQEILKTELVPDEYHFCVIAAVDPDALKGTEYAGLVKLPSDTLLSGFPNDQGTLLSSLNNPAPASVEQAPASTVPTEDEVSARALLSIHNERGFRSIASRASLAAVRIARQSPLRKDGSPFGWQLKILDEILGGTDDVYVREDHVVSVVWSDKDPRFCEAGRQIVLGLRGGKTYTALEILEVMRFCGYVRPHRSKAEILYAQISELSGIREINGTLMSEEGNPPAEIENVVVSAPEPEPAPARARPRPVAFPPPRASAPTPEPAPVVEEPVEASAPAPAPVVESTPAPQPEAKNTNTEIADMTLILVQATIQGAGAEPAMLRDMGPVQQAIGRVAQRIKSENNMPWELFNNYGDSGPKRVVIELQTVLAREGLPKGIFYVERTDPLVGADLLTVLRQAGAVVVRGAI